MPSTGNSMPHRAYFSTLHAGLRKRAGSFLEADRFIRGVTVLAGGAAAAQIVTVLGWILITRIYSPNDLGILAVYISLLSIAVLVASWRYERAVLLPKDDVMAINLLVLCILVALVMSLAIGAGVWLLGREAAGWDRLAGITPYLWLLPVGALVLGVHQVLSYWAMRRSAYGLLARTRLSQAVVQSSAQVILGLFGGGAGGLLLGDVVGRSSGAGALVSLVLREDRRTLRGVSLSGLLHGASRYRRFPLVSSWSALLSGAGMYAPPIIIAYHFGAAIAGWYALTQRVLAVPMTLVSAPICQVYAVESAAIGRSDNARQKALFWSTFRRLAVVAAVAVMLIVAPAPLIFGFVFGEAWVESAHYLQIMAPAFVFEFIGGPLVLVLDALERQDLFLVREVLRVVVIFGALGGAAIAGLGPRDALFALSAAGVVSYTAAILLAWHAIDVNQPR